MKKINYILGSLKNNLYLNDPLSENIFDFCDDLSKIILKIKILEKILNYLLLHYGVEKKTLNYYLKILIKNK